MKQTTLMETKPVTHKPDAAVSVASAHHADEYLTKREIAERLRKKIRTIDNWMRRGILPYYKIGRTVSFKWSDVQSHLDANCRVCRRRNLK